jgi:hypothetical protein
MSVILRFGQHVDGGRRSAGIGGTDHDVRLGVGEFQGLRGGVAAAGFRQQLDGPALVPARRVDLLDGELGGGQLGGVQEGLGPGVVEDQPDPQGPVAAGLNRSRPGVVPGS